MHRVGREYKEREVTLDGGRTQLMENVREEMKRLERLQELDWSKGDYFKFEE